MTNQLPDRANLDHLKQQAQDLLRAVQSGDVAAVSRVKAFVEPGAVLNLTKAQFVVAREYGFESWNRLRAHVLAQAEDRVARSRRYAEALIRHQRDVAEEMLSIDGTLATGSIEAAIATGQVEVVRAALAKGELRAGEVLDGGYLPLVYACLSMLARSTSDQPRLLEVARMLLDAGADPDTRWMNPDWDEGYSETVLYGAVGRADYPALTRLLLERGANPNDGECLYHSAECQTSENLQLLLEYGVKIGHPNEIARHFDFEHPDWIRIIVRHFKPEELPAAIPHAIHRGRSLEAIRAFVEGGVDVDKLDHWGRRGYQTAARMGRTDVCELLASHGADTTLSEADKVILRLAKGETLASADVSESVIAELDGEKPPLVLMLAERNKTQELAKLLAIGVNPSAIGQNGETALHQANWNGYPEASRLLIAAGADPTIKDGVYSADCWGWLCHGSLFSPKRLGTDHVAIVGHMAAAFDVPTVGDEDASPTVVEAMRRYTQA